MSNNKIESGRHDRQLRTMGKDTMQNMRLAKVFISGLGGHAMEILKNVILSGVGNIFIFDEAKKVTVHDLGVNWLLKESDIGLDRTRVCIERLRELDPSINIQSTTEMDLEYLSGFTCVVFVNADINNIKTLATELHDKTTVIVTSVRGVLGYIFSDFGTNYTVADPDDEKSKSFIIESIDDTGILVNGAHALSIDDIIKTKTGTFKVTEIVADDKFKVDHLDNIAVGDAIEMVKMPATFHFKSLEESIAEPTFVTPDFSGKAPQLFEVLIKNGTIANKAYYEKILHNNSCLDGFVTTNSVFGGYAANEMIKACIKKYTPIPGWMFLDTGLDMLPANYKTLDFNVDPNNPTRYDNIIKLFGRDFLIKLHNLRVFVIGSGAIGCEQVKNLALLGIGSGNGKIIITDPDTIALSNLSRQLLFREENVGQFKSEVAARAAKNINPEINIEFQLNKVSNDTISAIYNQDFFKNINLMIGALDNVLSRQYISSKSVEFRIPLLEAGTLGARGNTQAIIPGVSQQYQGKEDKSEESIPMCTIHNTPSNINHVVQFLLITLKEHFIAGPLELNQSFENGSEIDKKLHHYLNNIPKNYLECLQLAIIMWHNLFHNNIKKLLEEMPPNHKTSDGKDFWVGSKKCPKLIMFDPNNEDHFNFVQATGFLIAQIYGITTDDFKDLTKIKSNIITLLNSPLVLESNHNQITLYPIEFEKDDDSNMQIKMIHSGSKIRAETYGIDPVDFDAVKGIAGKIIPAIVTTTAIVSGFSLSQVVNILFENKTTYTELATNLSTNSILVSKSRAAKTVQYKGIKCGLWEQLVINNNNNEPSIYTFVEQFEKQYGITIGTIFYKETMLMVDFVDDEPISQLLTSKLGINFKQGDCLKLTIVEEEDEEKKEETKKIVISLPIIKYIL